MTHSNKTAIKDKIKSLKKDSGSHSPSIATLLMEIQELTIEVDACFLSNPYATSLFIKNLKQDLLDSNKLEQVLEYYPPQNYDVARFVSKAIGIDASKIFVGNGASEIIQAIIHRFVDKRIGIPIPTFSSYYEFARPLKEVAFYELKKEDNFHIVPSELIEFVKNNKLDSLVLINPNNPNGGYLTKDELSEIISGLPELKNIIIDESFIHFAYEDIGLSQITSEELIKRHNNIIIVKSLSKDFGIAGIRAGYALMNENLVKNLNCNGYLWNVSGLADYFFKLYANREFIKEYDVIRKKYIMNTLMFLSELNGIKNIKVYPSKANFALVEILNGKSSFDFCMDMLIDHHIYVRDCSDKIGLNGEFIRVASRTFEENLKIIAAIKDVVSQF